MKHRLTVLAAALGLAGVPGGPAWADVVPPGNSSSNSVGTVQASGVDASQSATGSGPAGSTATGQAPGTIGGSGGNSADNSVGTAPGGGGNSANGPPGTGQSGPASGRPSASPRAPG